MLERDELKLRSKWSLELPDHGLWTAPGVWTGLNYFIHGNHYGPFVLEFPLWVLTGKRFMIFRRIDKSEGKARHRHFFVQYETDLPIYKFKNESWRVVDPYVAYFKKLDSSAIWDIVLTQPLDIARATIKAVNHPKCIPGKCHGSSEVDNARILKEIAKSEISQWLSWNRDYANLLKRFPMAQGANLKLPKADEEVV